MKPSDLHSVPTAPEGFHNRLCQTLADLPERKEVIVLKRKKWTKILLAAAMVAVLLTTAAVAGGRLRGIASSTPARPTYRDLPTVEQMEADIGCTPKLLRTFSNGYTFDSGYLSSNRKMDESWNVIDRYQSLEFTYVLADADVELSMSAQLDLTVSSRAVRVDAEGLPALYYSAAAYKFVPADYTMTEQDRQDEADGTYIFSYGTDRVELSDVQYVSWQDGGVAYGLLAADSDLTRDDLVQMARELIEAP